VRVAVIVKLPVLETVTPCEARTPFVNAAVVPAPAESGPVEVTSTVPVNPVTVLLPASRATTRTLKLVPAVCVPTGPPPAASTRKWSSAPGLTVNEALVPDWEPPLVRVAVIVKLPVFEIVTACEASTPAVNAAVVPEPVESVPVEPMSTVPVKPVAMLPSASRAVTRTLNPLPAVWGPIAPPPAASTTKSETAPASTLNELLVPVCEPPLVRVAVIAKMPLFEIVTAWDARTPLLNVAVVPPPDERVPVEVTSIVLPAPLKPVTVLPSASRAVTRTSKLVPAVWVPIEPPPAASTRNVLSAPGLTVNEALVPD
jgi:hypothetical protein